MYENTPDTVMQWVTAIPGHIPDQAVVYEERSRNDIMYIVAVTYGSSKTPGLYETDKSCAEYWHYPDGPECFTTFEFLVLKHREYPATAKALLNNHSPSAVWHSSIITSYGSFY